MPNYAVRITKDYLVFSAGHFITYNGDVCERLHGHNYRVAAEVAAPASLGASGRPSSFRIRSGTST